MTLGQRIRTLRIAKNLSQPEFAKMAGIEQSYLSKLENDKSIPSNDMLRQILTAFSLELSAFLDPVNLEIDYQRLKQIPDVETYLNKQKQSRHSVQRKMLYASCIMITLSVAFFYAGFTKQLFSETVYIYKSPGIVFDNEPDNIFSRWRFLIDDTLPNYNQRIDVKRLEMANRQVEEFVYSNSYKGEFFREELNTGRRHYRLDKDIIQPRKINIVLQITGVMLLVSGLLGFVLERRWPKLQRS